MKKILIVVDMQNDFIYGKLSTKEAQNIVNPIFLHLVNNVALYDKIIFTKDTHEYKEFDQINNYELTTFEGRYFEQHCTDSADRDIVYPLSKTIGLSNTTIGLKNHFDGAWRIFDILERAFPTEKEGFQFYLCGVCTDICVLATAIGLTKGKLTRKISVITDLCAGTSPKAHKAAVTALKPFRIETITTKEFKKRKEKKGE